RGLGGWSGVRGGGAGQWYPDLVYDNHPVDQPRSPEDGYHLTDDLTDKAIEFIQVSDGFAAQPEKRHLILLDRPRIHGSGLRYVAGETKVPTSSGRVSCSSTHRL